MSGGKVNSPWLSVFVLGILAGTYIGFGGLLSTTVTFDLVAQVGIGLTKFLAGSAFSLGLMLVVIAGAELFTGNNLMVSSVMTKGITLDTMAKRWALVYVANFVGSIILALIFYFSGLWKTGNGALGSAAVDIAFKKADLGFIEALVRGIGCNWLVCLAVWMTLLLVKPLARYSLFTFRSWASLPSGLNTVLPLCTLSLPAYFCTSGRELPLRRLSTQVPCPGLVFLEKPAPRNHRQHNRRRSICGNELLGRLPQAGKAAQVSAENGFVVPYG